MAIRNPDGTVEYQGQVLTTWERNMYDDSDFYAEVWDAEENRVKSIMYNTTRFGGGSSASTDADYDTRKIASIKQYVEAAPYCYRYEFDEAAKIVKGDEVVFNKSFSPRKQNDGVKIDAGTEGVAFWVGIDQYNTSKYHTSYTVGVELANGNRVFVPYRKLQKMDILVSFERVQSMLARFRNAHVSYRWMVDLADVQDEVFSQIFHLIPYGQSCEFDAEYAVAS